MKFLALLKGECKASLPRLPLVFLFIGLCLAAVVAALPIHLLQRGETIGNLNIVVSTPDNSDTFEEVLSYIRMEEHVADIKLVSHKKGLQAIENKQADFYLEFPENFDDSLFNQEKATIKMRSSNPILGSVGYQILDSAVNSLNQMQNASLTYYQALKSGDFSRKERANLSRAFDLQLVQLALLRGKYVKIEAGASQYYLQLLALVLFVSTGIIAGFYAITTARQEKEQVFRKLLTYHYSLGEIWLSKLLMCLLLTIPVILFALWMGQVFDLELHLPYLIGGELLLMGLLYSLLTAVTTLFGKTANTSNALLINFVMLLVLMVLGGLIYPVYSQSIRFTTGNPAWLAQVWADNIFTGKLYFPAWPVYGLTFIGCGFLTILSWRKRL